MCQPLLAPFQEHEKWSIEISLGASEIFELLTEALQNSFGQGGELTACGQ